MTEARDRNPGVEIEIGFAIDIGQGGAVSVIDRQFRKEGNRLQSGRDEFLFGLEEQLLSRRAASSRSSHIDSSPDQFRDRLARFLATRREGRPVVQVDQGQMAIAVNNHIPTKDR